ncbi:MAG: hypothetical protein K2X11_16045 [Acetobacteraceae bacterium]|nr:hypothetical protein [Acetobacteraceae bacterium]
MNAFRARRCFDVPKTLLCGTDLPLVERFWPGPPTGLPPPWRRRALRTLAMLRRGNLAGVRRDHRAACADPVLRRSTALEVKGPVTRGSNRWHASRHLAYRGALHDAWKRAQEGAGFMAAVNAAAKPNHLGDPKVVTRVLLDALNARIAILDGE